MNGMGKRREGEEKFKVRKKGIRYSKRGVREGFIDFWEGFQEN